MNLANAKVIYIGCPYIPPDVNWILKPEDISDFLHEHNALVILSDDIYMNWYANAHHFTTRFFHKTLLPTLCNKLGCEVPYDKLVWAQLTSSEGYDLSRYKIKDGNRRFNVWSFTYNVGLTGPTKVLECNDYVVNHNWPNLNDMATDYHKMYVFPHTCSKVINLNEDNNGKRLLISCDSQSIPLIPILSLIYKEVWVFDNRYSNVSFKNELENTEFDDILLLVGYSYSLDKYTTWNLK